MNLKDVALKSIAATIDAGVAALAGRCAAGDDDEESNATPPCLRVVEVSGFAYEAMQEDVVSAPDAQTFVLSKVGWFTGDVELRLYARNKVERNDLEEAVRQLFLAGVEDQAGLLRATTPQIVLGGVTTLASTTIACDWTSEDWREEFVFSRKRYSFIRVAAEWPALIVRTSVPTIQQLQLQIAFSVNATVAAETNVIT
jgi:hypothetical protein